MTDYFEKFIIKEEVMQWGDGREDELGGSDWLLSNEDWLASLSKFPVLKILYEKGVFSVGVNKKGNFCFSEECDIYFNHTLSRSELLELSRELASMAEEK
ncbi:MAG: hypothetical protein P8P29_04695 [Flavobacteriaceae bacterium]|nr:hypothetical protein [Flavobacteriaceae bacterium]